MLVAMKQVARSLSAEDVEILEGRLGFHLPHEYKKFLLQYNGGRPVPRAFPIIGLEKNPFGVIQVFFGIDDPIESCNLDWNYEIMNGRLPSNLFAIACDDGGDLVCLSLLGEDAGSVLFWDAHMEKGEPSCRNVYRIADSFNEFMNGLQELPESA